MPRETALGITLPVAGLPFLKTPSLKACLVRDKVFSPNGNKRISRLFLFFFLFEGGAVLTTVYSSRTAASPSSAHFLLICLQTFKPLSSKRKKLHICERAQPFPLSQLKHLPRADCLADVETAPIILHTLGKAVPRGQLRPLLSLHPPACSAASGPGGIAPHDLPPASSPPLPFLL